MKKIEGLFLILLVLLLLDLAYSQSGMHIGLTIIDTQGPIINLISPINNSGDADGNITFYYNVSDAGDVDNCTLMIDGIANTTEVSPTEDATISFRINNTDLGTYNWSIDCFDNQSYPSSTVNRSFTVSSMKKFNGSTTNISLVDVRNITDFILEITPYGKMNFNEIVDLSRGLDIDRYVNMSFNRIEVNSSALFELNKSVNLSLYYLLFTDPRPLRDGIVCPSSICTEISYYWGIFVYSVSHFTVYSSEESPAIIQTVTVTAGGGGGGGGGGGATVTRVASLEIIAPATLALYTNDSITIPIILRNTGEIRLNDINLSSLIKAEGITVEIADTYFKSLGINETNSTNILIRTNVENKSRSQIIIMANVSNPKLGASVSILLDVVDVYEINRTEVQEKIKFALDLFEENPECLELKELLEQAQEALDNGEIQKALFLVESAIEACRQIVGKDIRLPRTEDSSEVGFRINLPNMFLISLLILLIILILALVIYKSRNIKWRKPSFNLGFKPKKKHKQKRVGPTREESESYGNEEKELNKMMRRRNI